MRHNHKGFSHIAILLAAVVLLAIGAAGWAVWNANKQAAAKQTASITEDTPDGKSDQASDEEDNYQPPHGWLKYEGVQGLSFYYPPTWDKAGFTVDVYGKNDPIPSKYGTPDSIVFRKDTSKWTRYLNYGTPGQKVITEDADNEYRIKTTTQPASKYPVAYVKMAHASSATYDIIIIRADNAFRIRLPEINTMDTNGDVNIHWQDQLNEQAAGLSDIIASLRFGTAAQSD